MAHRTRRNGTQLAVATAAALAGAVALGGGLALGWLSAGFVALAGLAGLSVGVVLAQEGVTSR